MARRPFIKPRPNKQKLLREQWEKLLQKYGIDPNDKQRGDRKPGERHDFVPMSSYQLPYRRDEVIASVAPITPPSTVQRPVYEGEMAIREQLAQEEIARKRLQVAPICNKGAYQYITNPDDWKTVGRKV